MPQKNVIFLSDFTDHLAMPITLGPYKVARALRDNGYEVTVIHRLHVFSVKEIKEILSQLVNEDTLFVGVNNFFYKNIKTLTKSKFGFESISDLDTPYTSGSLLPHGSEFNTEIKQLIKEKNPNCKLTLGGPGAGDRQENKIFDYIFLGYSDVSIVNLADHLRDKKVSLEKAYKSIYGPIVINDSKAENYNFAETPMFYEKKDTLLPGETIVTEIARGCIFKCAFCSYPLNGKKKLDFIKHKNLLIKEFTDNYEKFGVYRYMFSDDTLNDSVEKCQMLYDISQELSFKIEYWAYIRLDLLTAHPETIDLLFNSGLKSAFFGIETFDLRAASTVGKGGSRQKLINTLRLIKSKYGDSVSLHGNFIFGLPYESLDSLKTTCDFLLSDDNPLDTYKTQTLMLLENIKLGNGFVSDIDLNYEKYGYKKLKKQSDEFILANLTDWENEYTSSGECQDLIKTLWNKVSHQNKDKVRGNYALWVMGTGIKESEIFNKKNSEIDWGKVDKVKLITAHNYRRKLTKNLGINDLISLPSKFKTFSEYLNSDFIFEN